MTTVYDYTANARSVKDLTSHRNNKLKQRINPGSRCSSGGAYLWVFPYVRVSVKSVNVCKNKCTWKILRKYEYLFIDLFLIIHWLILLFFLIDWLIDWLVNCLIA